MNNALAKKIDQMAKEDQEMRRGRKKGVGLDVGIDKRHTTELKGIIKKYGWPTITLVGKKASSNAWLLAQHADHDRKFQEQVLELLKGIDRTAHDIDRANIAYLTDRLLVAKREKQQFGTQFNFGKDERLVLHPISNLRKVDKLRKEYDLPPLKEFTRAADEFNAQKKKAK